MQYTRVLRLTLMLCMSVVFVSAQQNYSLPVADTLNLQLDSAEHIFLRNNLLLLAQHYNINAQQALEIQAKLYPNPNVSVATALAGHDPNLQPPSSNKPFPSPFSNAGEASASISQEIVIAGKRNKAIKLAKSNTRLAEYQFYDLLRTLKYTLRTDFFTIYYLLESGKVYKEEIDGLQTVVDAYNQLLKEGKFWVSEKEIVRVKAQLYSLQSEYQDLVDQINNTQSELRLLLQVKPLTHLVPQVDTSLAASANPLKYPLPELVDSAYKRRTDLKIAQTNTEISRLNFSYQKAMAVPDPSLNVNYDKQGSYIRDLFMGGVAIDLPAFNRNQGNIRSAKFMIKMNEMTEQSIEKTVEENVYRALQESIDADKLYRKVDPSFKNDYSRLIGSALDAYKKRTIGLLDFLDFYDSYKQNTLQINGIQLNKLNALESINFYTGFNFFN
ncbi:TolC family protein [Chitinophaga arvensicola]|uniref:Outer membrane protein, cobalt-zinc-cadmium efflux system n=1 Tax=Chitinophaga arvensicola TaxID=29529 RepID=A0A1I0S798_9BACT|nr:TolC family protein [Chitinophaga arvensicola]SEW51555.1 outer membrane protein, cobalt-zinc-cadmium efflux system [Chitinophaga arvensicola]